VIDSIGLFISGTQGYHTFRIPALTTTPAGTVLAFCEGRKSASSDSGDIDILLRRSEDGGQTWNDMQLVWDDGPHTCGNPCPVVDRRTGAISLLLTHNLGHDVEPDIIARTSEGTRTVWLTRSEDEGRTWSPPPRNHLHVQSPDLDLVRHRPGRRYPISRRATRRALRPHRSGQP
jgi:sialidase-1